MARKYLGLFLLALLPVACETPPKYGDFDPSNLEVGMSRQEAVDQTGLAFHDMRGNGEAWFFVVEQMGGTDFRLTREDCAPVVLRDGRVTGWGEDVRADASLIAYGDAPPLRSGMSRRQVEALLGKPAFVAASGNRMALYYPLSPTGSRPAEVTKANCVPIILVDDEVAGYGEGRRDDADRISAGSANR